MPTSKRVTSRAPAPGSLSSSGPLTTAVLLGSALTYGVSILVSRGRMQWPPTQLLASLYTLAGCLALVGPIVLHRRESTQAGLGELIWIIGGLVIWVFDAAALIQGETRTLAWATPLSYQPMGLTVLAVALGAARRSAGGSDWSWTNVTGWALGIFWIAMGATTLLPARTLGLVLR